MFEQQLFWPWDSGGGCNRWIVGATALLRVLFLMKTEANGDTAQGLGAGIIVTKAVLLCGKLVSCLRRTLGNTSSHSYSKSNAVRRFGEV